MAILSLSALRKVAKENDLGAIRSEVEAYLNDRITKAAAAQQTSYRVGLLSLASTVKQKCRDKNIARPETISWLKLLSGIAAEINRRKGWKAELLSIEGEKRSYNFSISWPAAK